MGTSAAVKNRWNSANYDRVYVTVPKGYGDRFREYCKEKELSVNSAVFGEVKRRMEAQRMDFSLPNEE